MTNKFIKATLESSLLATQSTNKSVKVVKPHLTRHRPCKYPWAEIEIGYSFIPDCSFASARVMAHNAGKRYKKEFRVVEHPNLVVEIARIA